MPKSFKVTFGTGRVLQYSFPTSCSKVNRGYAYINQWKSAWLQTVLCCVFLHNCSVLWDCSCAADCKIVLISDPSNFEAEFEELKPET